MEQASFDNLKLVGPPTFGTEAVAAARKIQRQCGVEPMAAPFLDACTRIIEPQAAEHEMRQGLPQEQLS